MGVTVTHKLKVRLGEGNSSRKHVMRGGSCLPRINKDS